MKTTYLESIKHLLERYEISNEDLHDILNDYSQMFDDGLVRGLSESEVIKTLGSPERVVSELSDGFKKRVKPHRGGKLVALMPFISVIVFFALGFGFNLWDPGWMVFLMIPMMAIIVDGFNNRNIQTLTALSPFITAIAFYILGTVFNAWNPGWLIFLLIPVSGICFSSKGRSFLHTLTALSPFLAVTSFVLLGTYAMLWNPGWLVFLLIPMIGILNNKNKRHVFWYELSFLAAISIYLALGYLHNAWALGLFGFLIPLCYGILSGNIQFSFRGIRLSYILSIFAITLVYIACGILFSAWPYLWVLFLLIPVIGILKHAPKKDRFVACSPFLAVTIFFLFGWFFNLWHISWLVFLIIPMAGILKEK